jgi:hypothetical protein
MKIAGAGKVVDAIYDALKANGMLVAPDKKNKKRKSKLAFAANFSTALFKLDQYSI